MKADVVRGHLDGLLLAALEDGPLHGYAIITSIVRRSGGALELPTGTVYPALHRLERAGLVTSADSTVDGRQRRTYRLTAPGSAALGEERDAWRRFTTSIGGALGARP